MAECSTRTMVLLFVKSTDGETPYQSKSKHRYHAMAFLLMVHLN